jgi:hypothetical protein
MAKRAPAQVDLCFDSMTDLITNLAGGLVLVVLLLLGMTQDSKKPERPPEFAPEKKQTEGGSKSIHPLEVQSQLLRLQIKKLDESIAALDKKMPKLEADVQELVARALKGAPKK